MRAISKLNLNNNPATYTNGDLVLARNVTATIDQKAIRNEDGFLAIAKYDGSIVGKVETPNGYVLFIKGVPDSIVYVCEDITKTITGTLGFNKPIKGRYTFNSEGDLYITFTEGVEEDANETRIINITKSPISLTKDDVDMLSLIPDVEYPTLNLDVISEGRLLAGTYQLAISYMVEESVYTNYSILHAPVYVFGNIEDHDKIGTVVRRSIKVDLANLDTRYTKYKIGILYKGEDAFETICETDDIPITTDSYTISSLDSLATISISDLTVGAISYIKDNDHVSFNGRLIRGNVRTVKYSNAEGVSIDTIMSNLASKVKVGITSREAVNSFESVDKNNIKKHFKEGEHYALYIGAIDYKGNFVNAYPVPWKQGDETEMALGAAGNSNTVHRVPYFDYSVEPPVPHMPRKYVADITMTLPANTNEILGTFTNIIKSVCYFYAEHTLGNSKILGQGFVIRDQHQNDFEFNQTYKLAYRSSDKLRFYSLEHLFNKSILSNAKLYNSKKLYGFTAASSIGANKLRRVFNDVRDSILNDRNHIALNSIEYVEHDNTVVNNIAGDSFHRIRISPTEANKLLGGTYVPVGEPNTGNIINNSGIDDTTSCSRNLMAISDLVSNSEYFYDNVYQQILTIASSIIPVSSVASTRLIGDFFYDNFTIRLTAPNPEYRYADSNADLQGEDYVTKVVISVNLESRFNLRARYSGANGYQKVFNIYTPANTDPIFAIPYKYDNFINTSEGKGYSISANGNGYNMYFYFKELDDKPNFFNRIIRSVVNTSESRGVAWRRFNAADYKDVPIEGGPINILSSDERAVYIQQEYNLSIVSLKDTLSNSTDGTSYLGSSDIFDREPHTIMYDEAGYIGCDNRFGGIMTPFGYAVVDAVRKNIFLIKLTNVSRIGNIDIQPLLNTLESGLTNPYAGRGFCLLYDDIIKSLFVTQNGIKSFTIHYNIAHKAWLSYHDYIPRAYISNREKSYCIYDNTVYKRHANNKGIYFSAIPAKCELIYVYNLEYDVFKLVRGIAWDTHIIDGDRVIYDRTFDKVMIYNSTQCTGLIAIGDNESWFDTASGVYVRDQWYFNQLVDKVINDKAPILDSNLNPIASNLRADHDWFSENNFISKFICIKFVYENNFVNIRTNETRTTPFEDATQLEVILNSYDVNATKSIR